MATPSRIPDTRAQTLRPVAPLITKFWRYTSEESESDWHDKEAEKLQVFYEDIPTRAAGVELHDVLEETSNSLNQVAAPLLLIYSQEDGTTPPESAQFIYDRVSSTDKEILWLENSGHNIPRDAARQQAFEAAAAFVRRVTQ